VHLVAVRVSEDHLAGDAEWALLTDAEARRARRFRFDIHRNRWVAARALLKRLIARYAGCESAHVRLGFGEIGKPFLKAPDGMDLRFNYTDSAGCLIYAFALGIEVGIDLEKLPRPTNHAGLAARKLSNTEQAVFGRLPEEYRELAFLASWTRKEAYGKALGVGIRYPMNEVTMVTDYGNARFDFEPDGASSRPALRLTQLSPPFPGIACLAAASRAHEIRGYTLEVPSGKDAADSL
jgi:4'-phosphopantetheinyl transferase